MTEPGDNVLSAEVCLPSTDLAADLAYFTQTLGFRLDTIYPRKIRRWPPCPRTAVRLELESSVPTSFSLLVTPGHHRDASQPSRI